MANFIKIIQADTDEKIIINIDKIVAITEMDGFMGTDEQRILSVIHLCPSLRDGITVDEKPKAILKKIKKARKAK
ncbi:hypothetical protein [Francisella philomiragia]|uniref:hypothetical protein n=1 Tax=Francisella philomiragia TaxID=28110 RepID=UPI00190767AA|nr:hypothetical protein [Francisella philomiragia]MBK2279823.1 hypothetical protein [Francisella philomiragia]MBK2289674.1 hypothetical protein [Francisella philomiragia]MBK2291611.1 hypothetical protein [Francisella philomiragia]